MKEGEEKFLHEATVAKRQGKLITVLLEQLTPDQFPMGLYSQQAINLSDWKGDYDDARRYFQQAIEEATRLGLTSEAARLSERRDRVGAVYNSQFRGL